MPLTLPTEYGYVLLVGAASTVFPIVLGGQVGGARSKAKVPYPHMYATQAECADDKNKLVFNCYQRAHQNFLENYPQFLFLLAVAGIQYPVIASVTGATWLVGRMLYAFNYQSGDASKRNNGVAWIHLVALLTLIVLGISTGVSLSLAAFASS